MVNTGYSDLAMTNEDKYLDDVLTRNQITLN